jgi:hypothetical protein
VQGAIVGGRGESFKAHASGVSATGWLFAGTHVGDYIETPF